jgi:hypothetical protein
LNRKLYHGSFFHARNIVNQRGMGRNAAPRMSGKRRSYGAQTGPIERFPLKHWGN